MNRTMSKRSHRQNCPELVPLIYIFQAFIIQIYNFCLIHTLCCCSRPKIFLKHSFMSFGIQHHIGQKQNKNKYINIHYRHFHTAEMIQSSMHLTNEQQNVCIFYGLLAAAVKRSEGTPKWLAETRRVQTMS